jgi:hypothetical protein
LAIAQGNDLSFHYADWKLLMIYSRLPFALTAAGLRSDCRLRAKAEQGAMPEKMRNLKQNRGEIERVPRK